MDRFAARQVVVTGAASGLGAAVVNACADAGAGVLALDIDDAAGATLAAATGARFLRCDVAAPSDWQAVSELLVHEGKRIDHLHLNAGIQLAPPSAPAEEYRFAGMTLERYRRLTSVNIDGVVFGLHHLVPLMNAGGSIVVTGSLAGLVPYDVDPLYSMTKHAITGLVRSLARELGQADIRINALCPGGIDTRIIPEMQKTDEMVLMRPEIVAGEVMRLFEVAGTGSTWAKVSEDRPAWIIEPPGRKR